MRHLPALVVSALALAPAPADAAMFCGSRPVEQRGQQVLLARDGDAVEATYAIAFQTTSPDVAWVLPVPARPTVALADPARLRDLGWRTQPDHRLRTSWVDVRSYNLWTLVAVAWVPLLLGAWALSSGAAAGVAFLVALLLLATVALPSFVGSSGPKVDVFAAGQLGPYETATLRATSPAALTAWLRAHGYVVPSRLEPVVAPYMAEGAWFVALRLRPGEGEPIRDPLVRDPRAEPAFRGATPITLRYRAKDLALPLRMASLSAARGMPLTVWVEGPARAVPANYAAVVPNPARIAWGRRGRNYRDVVAAAVREAGGRGFVTDFARPGLARDGGYLTRLVTALDPEAMTEDPRFVFAPALPAIDRRDAAPVAAPDGVLPFGAGGARWVTADGGLAYRLAHEARPTQPVMAALPALWRAERLGADGRLHVERDNTAAIRAVLDHTAVAIDADGVARAAGPTLPPRTRELGLAVGVGVPALWLLALVPARSRRALNAATPRAVVALGVVLVASAFLG